MSSGVIDRGAFERLEGLRVRAREVGEGVLSGLHESRFHGASVVFAEHREYRPGDDPRTLDVRAWARTDRPVVRRFEHEARLSTTLLLDASGSMAYSSVSSLPTKHAYAALLLSALAYILLRQGDAVAAIRFASHVDEATPSLARLASLERVLSVFEASPRADARTHVSTVLESVLPSVARRSVVVLASDLLELGRPLDVLRAYAASGHRPVVFHVVDPAESGFPFRGAAEFHGLEGEAALTADATAARDAYLAAFTRHADALRDACANANARYVFASTDVPVERTLADVLVGGPL